MIWLKGRTFITLVATDADGNTSAEATAPISDTGGSDTDGPATVDSVIITVYRNRPILPAELTVAPEAISFVVAGTGTTMLTQTLSLRNAGDGALKWTATTDSTRANPLATTGTTPADIQVEFDPIGLKEGTYTGQITLLSTEARNKTVTVPYIVLVDQAVAAGTQKPLLLPLIRRGQ